MIYCAAVIHSYLNRSFSSSGFPFDHDNVTCLLSASLAAVVTKPDLSLPMQSFQITVVHLKEEKETLVQQKWLREMDDMNLFQKYITNLCISDQKFARRNGRTDFD